ncbi:MAG: hypothetical protein K0S33_1816 [Bacteroidetes bacterium]|jgi:hypothetical protein|nr:hypothetical protein [Bacteroidota bacterium]
MKTSGNKFTIAAFLLIGLFSFSIAKAQTKSAAARVSLIAKVDFDAYEKLVSEVKAHRKTRLVGLEEFFKMSGEAKTIILDTRSDAMYKSKHVKGAIHLNFSDFTQSNLAKIIPSSDYRILIYCNNNFDNDDLNFASKAYIPAKPKAGQKELTLALNIPTYINLYGYGYKNVYELSELISVFDPRIEFEGTSVRKGK